ncbi:hypothetical protein ACEPUE_35295, partial [Burkholderia ubonensis]
AARAIAFGRAVAAIPAAVTIAAIAPVAIAPATVASPVAVVAPDAGYGYGQTYYSDPGYAYGPAYAPVYGTVNVWGGGRDW